MQKCAKMYNNKNGIINIQFPKYEKQMQKCARRHVIKKLCKNYTINISKDNAEMCKLV